MKLKRILTGIVAATVLIVSVNYVPDGASVVHAEEFVYSEIDADELKANASANSWSNSDNDKGAQEAFDRNFTTLWHQNYSGNSAQGPGGEASESNPIWIQTKFAEPRMVGKLEYRDRDNGNNIIGKYTVSIANEPEAEEPTTWKVVADGTFDVANQPLHTVTFTPEEATHIRLTAYSKIGNGSEHVVASEIYVYEALLETDSDYAVISNVKAPSEQSANGQTAGKAADGTTGTKWHTLWGQDSVSTNKNWIDFELSKDQKINGLEIYYESVSNIYHDTANGRVLKYEIWVSDTGDTTSDAGGNDDWKNNYIKVCSGSYTGTEGGWKTAKFESITAKYVRFVAIETGGDPRNKFVCVPEFHIVKAKDTVVYTDVLGTGLRKDFYQENNDGSYKVDEAGNKIRDYSKTSMRFGYDIKDITDATVSTWKWTWGIKNEDGTYTWRKTVSAPEGQQTPKWTTHPEYGNRVSNLVVTGVPKDAYTQDVCAQLAITYEISENENFTVYTAIQTSSVEEVVQKIVDLYMEESANRTLDDEAFAKLEEDYEYATGIKDVMSAQ